MKLKSWRLRVCARTQTVRRNRSAFASIEAKEPFITPISFLAGRAFQTGIRASQESIAAPAPPQIWSDAQLVARLAQSENDALALIYDRYGASLFRVLNAILNSPADAEDALQEVFVSLATGRVRRIRDLKSYLLVAARHQAFSLLRRRQRERGWEDVSELEIAIPQTPDCPHDFTALLARLPIEQREVIALHVWEGLTFAEIAPVVKASPNTVMSRYRYGIARLKTWCEEENRD